MKFQYVVLPGDPSQTSRPLVKAKLKHKSRLTPEIFFLVDSGADYSYADKNIADWLRIDLTKSKPVTSFAANNSSFQSYPAETTIEIGGHEIKIPIFYTENLGYQSILGQEVIFDKFRVIFERYKNQFQLIPKYNLKSLRADSSRLSFFV